MQLSLLLGRQIISMFLIVIVGYLMVHTGKFSKTETDALARINLSIICPCAIFNSLQREFSMDRLTGLAVAIFAAIVVHILFIGVERIIRKPMHFTPAESASIMYSNALNLIIPLVSATLSDDMLFYVSAFAIVQTVLLWSHCLMIVSHQRTIRLKSILNVNIFASILGLIFYLCRLQLPSILSTTVTNIGNMVGPVSMLVIGMLIGPIDLKTVFTNKRAYLIAFFRLLVFPIIVVLVLRFSGMLKLHPDASNIYLVTILASASCTAATVPQQCQVYGDEGAYASVLNVMTLFFCIITMPFIVLVYQMLL